MSTKEKYAILLRTYETNYGQERFTNNDWYWGSGKYMNTFSTSSTIRSARFFPSIAKAEELLQSERFQKRLAFANDLQRRCGYPAYTPEIRKVEL